MPEESPLVDLPKGTLMQGKRGLIMGVANDRSLAWGIARAVAAQGGELAFELPDCRIFPVTVVAHHGGGHS